MVGAEADEDFLVAAVAVPCMISSRSAVWSPAPSFQRSTFQICGITTNTSPIAKSVAPSLIVNLTKPLSYGVPVVAAACAPEIEPTTENAAVAPADVAVSVQYSDWPRLVGVEPGQGAVAGAVEFLASAGIVSVFAAALTTNVIADNEVGSAVGDQERRCPHRRTHAHGRRVLHARHRPGHGERAGVESRPRCT